MLGRWELKSVVVLSNAQPFDRSLPIYYRVREVPFDIPQGYVKGHSIYRMYMEEMQALGIQSWKIMTASMFTDVETCR